MVKVIDTDVLVIGGGGAAARAALEARRSGARVTMVMKGKLGKCGATAYRVAEIAGYNAADGQADPEDTPEEHFKDILAASAGTCDERLARILAREAPLTLADLESWGVPLEKDGDRYLEIIGCFASRPRTHIIRGHSEPLLAAIVRQLRELDVSVVEDSIVTRLLVQDGRCLGAVAVGRDGEMLVFRAAATTMGTGGAGQLFRHNLNPPDMTGDGYALGLHAGAELVNMEFMQAGAGLVGSIRLIFNQWLWMLHPKVYNSEGEAFLRRYVPPGMSVEQCMDLKSYHYPFSCYIGSHWIEVGIQQEVLAGRGTPDGGVYVDLSGVSEDGLPATPRGDEVRKMWPMTRQFMQKRGINVTRDPLKVGCFGHAINGGMLIDENTETTIRGLFAAGEAAGGPHGADRLGGNMVVTCQVFGKRMGQAAARLAAEGRTDRKAEGAIAEEETRLKALAARKGTLKPQDLKRRVQDIMSRGILVIRNEVKLQTCLRELRQARADWESSLLVENHRDLWAAQEVDNMLQVGEIMARAALLRTESRGSHYRDDYPRRDDGKWEQSIVIQQREGRIELHPRRLPRVEAASRY